LEAEAALNETNKSGPLSPRQRKRAEMDVRKSLSAASQPMPSGEATIVLVCDNSDAEAPAEALIKEIGAKVLERSSSAGVES